MKLLLFEKNEIHPKAIELLKMNGIEVIDADLSKPQSNNNIEVIFIRTYTKVNEPFLNSYPHLKYILRAGVGLDNIDKEACVKKGIQIFNSPGSNANAVAELVICFMLMMSRKMMHQIESLKKGNWRDMNEKGEELQGKTIGIIGCGAVGQLVSKKLQNFDVHEILGYDPFLSAEVLEKHGIKKVELDDIIKSADYITLHLPLLPETKNLISEKQFSLMKQGSYLINTSRGGIVNEQDLIEALRNNTLAGAALDVFETEPEVKQELLQTPHLIATPHIGALTEEADEAMSVEAVKNFLEKINNS